MKAPLSYKIGGDYPKMKPRHQKEIRDILKPEMRGLYAKYIWIPKGDKDFKYVLFEYEISDQSYRCVFRAS